MLHSEVERQLVSELSGEDTQELDNIRRGSSKHRKYAEPNSAT